MSEIPVLVFENIDAFDLADFYLLPKDQQESLFQQLKEQVERANQLKRKNEFYEQVLDLAGFDIAVLEDTFKKKEQLRLELKDDLESPDPKVKEIAIKKMTDEIAQLLLPIINSKRYEREKNEYESQLKVYLTEQVWNRLKDDSKQFLITALFTFYQLKANDFLDYSSVCILITKALENEVTYRLFDQYIEYLKDERKPIEDWPWCLVYEKPKTGEKTIINRNDFTLGTVPYLIGAKNKLAFKSEVGLELVDESLCRLIGSYYIRRLLNVSFVGSEKEKVLLDCTTTETARLKFRNPAAHTKTLSASDAYRCIEYLVTKEKRLFHFLKDLRI